MFPLAFQDYQNYQDYYVDQGFPWTELIAPAVLLVIAISILVWTFPYVRRAYSQAGQCLEQSKDAMVTVQESIELSRESIRLTREQNEVLRETNRLLAELNDSIKNRE
ncbi:MAG: hypothetical protein ACKVT0_10680 [Planctomycetaceae bacterium]